MRFARPNAWRKCMRTPLNAWFAAGAAFCSLAGTLPAAEPLATIECREVLGRNWPRTMVTYCVQGPGERVQEAFGMPEQGSPAWVAIKDKVRPDALRLVDPAGQEVPSQLWRVKTNARGDLVSARLSFMAELAKNSNYVYRLIAGVPAATAGTGVLVATNGDGLVLDNSVTAARLPPAGAVTFAKPLSFGAVHQDMLKLYGRQAASGIAPGPIQGVRMSDGRWVGGSYFQAADPARAPAVLGYSCAVTERGPVFTEATIRYRFDGDRYYQMAVRLLPGDPAIRIDEQFDMKRVGSTRDWRGYSSNDWQVVMSLSSGWQPSGWKPDVAFWERYSYGGSLEPQKLPEEASLKELGFDFGSTDFGTSRVVYQDPAAFVLGLEPWCPWGKFAACVGLVEGRALPAPTGNTNAPPDPARLRGIPFLGLVPAHAGSWRADGPFNYKQLLSHQGDDVALHWPLDVLPHPNSIVHTGEYDRDMPFTFCRRLWTLIAGPMQTSKSLHAFRSYEGYVNLDTYKDWILDWPDDPKVTYPRLFFTQADVKRVEPVLDQHPAGNVLKTYLDFHDGEARRNELWKRLTGLYGPFGIHNQTEPDISYYFTLFRQAHSAEEWLAPMEELLSSPGVTPEQRRFLKQRVAAFCYLAAEPDFNPRGSMTHLGNPNMAINRFLALTFAAALIPDHPRATEWMKVSEDYVGYKLSMNTGPGGGWSELFSYYDASAPALLHGANILHTAGRLSDRIAPVAELVGTFPLYYLSPRDPRFGVRLVSCWGHEGHGGFGQWLPTAGLARQRNPDLARALVWGWDQTGRLAGFHDGNFNARCIFYADLLNGLPAGYVPAMLGSQWLPGVGAVLRAHAGDPNETFLAYRQGYFISHCDDNQGDFVLYSKGAPLVDLSLLSYNLHQHEPYIALNREFGWYSAPRFGSRTNTTDVRQGSNAGIKAGSWNPSSEIHAHSFGASADYLRGHSDNEGRRWTRQILFLKGRRAAGPNYFVFRDTADPLPGATNAAGPMWWNIRTLGSKAQVAATAQDVNCTSTNGPRLNVHFLQPASIAAETRDESREGSALSHVDAWRKDGEPFLKPDQSAWVKIRETLSVTSVGPVEADPGVLAALYPQAAGEAAPRYEALADGVARITTSEGTDYVFVNRRPMQMRQGDVAFSGKAGAVRVYPDEIHLVIAEGPGEVTYKGCTLRSAGPATRVIKPGDAARATAIDVAAAPTSIRIKGGRGDQELQPGVTRADLRHGFRVTFETSEALSVKTNGLVFNGRRGMIEVDEAERTVRLVLLDGDRIGYGDAQAWGGDGPYEVVFRPDRIEGRSEGQGRFLCLTQPAGVDRLASLVIDGLAYAPGTSNTIDPAISGRAQGAAAPEATGGTLVVPLMPGAHRFEVKNLAQPAVWRNWQWW